MREDQDLRQLFEELRAHDRDRTPAFDAVLARARSPRPRHAWTALRVAAAAVLVAGAATTALLLRHRDGGQVALADWRAPTDVLLNLPGMPALDSLPDATGSLIRVPTSSTSTTPSRRAGHAKGDTT